ncbi:MAG TPA: hypothetical protein VK324_09075 [Tepidisphaeraceae bacterium]|nr:hypothetical protein [Tepidisphaeraceae bacterium]
MILLRIEPWVYAVRVWDVRERGPLLGPKGKPAGALWDEPDHTLWLSTDLPRQRWLKALLHEFRHAWNHNHGRAVTDEQDCNSAAGYAESFYGQLDRQGGRLALLRLGADGVSSASNAPDDCPGEARGSSCPVCEGQVAEGSIHTELPRFDAGGGKLVADRSFYCDACRHVVAWAEGATPGGRPNGRAGMPRFVRGPECAAWLRAHGRLAGIIVTEDPEVDKLGNDLLGSPAP